jgi:hypothetical protein
MQDSGATDLSALLGSGPVQNPSLPQSTTFAPMVTGGGDPFISPINTTPQQKPAATVYNHDATFNSIRYAIKNLMVYFGFFVAAVIISLSTPRSLLLQYIPHTYTSGGVVSYSGAAVLAGVAVAIAYVVGTLGSSLI